MVEKRTKLAEIVRTTRGKLDSCEVRIQDKLKAIELDARLSGELEDRASTASVVVITPAALLEKVRALSPILASLTGGKN